MHQTQLLRRRGVWGAIASVALVGVLVAMGVPAPAPLTPSEPLSQFLQDVDRGRVARVLLAESALTVTSRSGATAVVRVPPLYIGTNHDLMRTLVAQGVRVDVSADAPARSTGLWLGFVLAVVGLCGYSTHRAGLWHLPHASSNAFEPLSSAPPQVRFQDLAGIDEAKDALKDIVDVLRAPASLGPLGRPAPAGVLLVGAPGSGKTLLARAVAGEAHVPLVSVNGTDLVALDPAVAATRITDLFAEARRHDACVLFVDDVDALGRGRLGATTARDGVTGTVHQLLTEMDAVAANRGIVVMAATSRADAIDMALLRPGRFDRHVVLAVPDVNGREQILRIHGRRVPLGLVDLRKVARGTPGFCGADLANLVDQAALLASRERRDTVTAEDLDRARERMLTDVERRSPLVTEAERVACAYHEAGHAAVAAALPGADPLHKVTIVPTGRVLGLTTQLPDPDRHTYTREFLEVQIAILMGGRAAEELFLRHSTSGSANDIERATAIAHQMVCEFGMSGLGPLAFRSRGGTDTARAAGVSEAMAQRVDDEIHALVTRGHARACEIIEVWRPGVLALAETLLVEEALNAERVHALLSGIERPPAVSDRRVATP